MFRRRRREEDVFEDVDTPEGHEAAGDGRDAGSEVGPPLAAGRPAGPWDVADQPDDSLQRIDLGGLRVPVIEGTEMRVDVSPEGEVVAATLVHGASTMQLNAFAAPRSEGIWGEVREEIVGALAAGGGTSEELPGVHGTELQARIPSDIPGQGRVTQAARFVGVDGPRWFLRALYTGPAATDPQQAAPLEEAFRSTVVVRGGDPMAARDALPLRLPREVTEASLAGGDGDGDDDGGEPDPPKASGLAPFERGPEITEVR